MNDKFLHGSEISISQINFGDNGVGQSMSQPDYFSTAPLRSPRMDAIKRELNINTFKKPINSYGTFTLDVAKIPSSKSYARCERKSLGSGDFDPSNAPLAVYLHEGWSLVPKSRHPETGYMDTQLMTQLRESKVLTDDEFEPCEQFVVRGNTILIEKDKKMYEESVQSLKEIVKEKEFETTTEGFNRGYGKHGMFRLDPGTMGAPGTPMGAPVFYR
jgi:hypothetical protein